MWGEEINRISEFRECESFDIGLFPLSLSSPSLFRGNWLCTGSEGESMFDPLFSSNRYSVFISKIPVSRNKRRRKGELIFIIIVCDSMLKK